MDYDLFNLIFVGSFFGCACVMSILWGGFNSLKYRSDNDVPMWTWVAIFLPIVVVAIATMSLWAE